MASKHLPPPLFEILNTPLQVKSPSHEFHSLLYMEVQCVLSTFTPENDLKINSYTEHCSVAVLVLQYVLTYELKRCAGCDVCE